MYVILAQHFHVHITIGFTSPMIQNLRFLEYNDTILRKITIPLKSGKKYDVLHFCTSL